MTLTKKLCFLFFLLTIKYINSQERISNHESGKLDDQVKQYQIALGIAD